MKYNTYLIERLSKKDLGELAGLEAGCFVHPWTERQFLKFIDQESFIIMGARFKGCRLDGYISFYATLEQAEIINLGVCQRCRSRGLGKLLVQKAIRVCKEKKVANIFLEVRPSNVPALKVYRSCGFREISIREKYYPDNQEDALVMRLDIE